MNTLTFLNPALLWGLGLAAIPLILHLLFRRRFRRIEWAPMRYLKLTIQRNRRRVQIEQLLLLLLRTALIIVLICLVSRPIVHAAGLGRWLGGDSRTSQIVILDDSLSMGLVTGGRSAFERAIDLADKLIEGVGTKDRLTLVLSTQPKTPLLREIELNQRAETVKLLRSLRTSQAFAAWPAALRSISDLLESTTYPTRDVTIITDLRRAGWEQDLSLPASWANDRVRVRIFNVGTTPARQVALDKLTQADRFALVGAPARWNAVVRNGSDVPLDGLEATLIVDGKPTQVALPILPPGEPISVPLNALFQEPGLHSISLRLPEDDLPGDNQRWDVVDVREKLHIILVDGEPSSEPLRGEVDFLALALSLAIGESSAPQVEVLTDAEWSTSGKLDADLIVLANVAGITPEQVNRLEKSVAAGVGLMIFTGDQVDPDNYNQQLYREGKGLLPLPLESIVDETISGLQLEENSPSAVDALRQLNPSVLDRIKTNKRYRLAVPLEADPAVRVLARWNDASSSPALVEKLVGLGRVLLWTTTADKNWSDWPTEPSYVLATREAAKAIARAGVGIHELTAGEALRRPVSRERDIQNPLIELPGADEPRHLTIESDAPGAIAGANPGTAGEKYLLWNDTGKAGLYRLNWQESPGGAASDLFAVNPDFRESDLAAMTAEELQKRWGNVHVEIISGVGVADSSAGVRGQEVWRTFALCLLVMMTFEAGFATWVGRQR